MVQSASTAAAMADWDCLFDAVTDRLRNVAMLAGTAPDRLGAEVLDCTVALGKLHAMLERERAQSRCSEPRPVQAPWIARQTLHGWPALPCPCRSSEGAPQS